SVARIGYAGSHANSRSCDQSRGSPEVDVTSLEMLEQQRNEFQEAGIELLFARASDPVRDLFSRSGFLDRLSEIGCSAESTWLLTHFSRKGATYDCGSRCKLRTKPCLKICLSHSSAYSIPQKGSRGSCLD